MTFNGDHDQQNPNLQKTIEDLFDQSLKSPLLGGSDYLRPVKLTLDAISLAPNDPNVLCKAAAIMFMVQNARGLELAQELYERLSIMEPDYSEALNRLCSLAMVNGQYDKASQYAWKLNGKHSEGNPKTLFLMARAFRLQGDKKQAQICYRQVIDTLCSGNSSFPDGAQSRLVPLAAYLGGWLDEAEEAMQRLCIAGGKKAFAENQALSPSLRTQLRKLREITRGKDICICGNGPSIQAFVDKPSLFKSKDIGFMGLNNFSIVWDDIIGQVDAEQMSLVIISHPNVLLNNSSDLEAFLRKPYPTMVLLSDFALYHVLGKESQKYLYELDHKIFKYGVNDDLPPSLKEPLNLPSMNTMLCALSIAVIGQPRRIFLLGFDQNISGDDPEREGAIRYKQNDNRYADLKRSVFSDSEYTAWRNHDANWLRWDAIRVNETSMVTLHMLSLIYGVDLPPIYNVCPNSALEAFPKIDVQKFKELISK